jgi:hypothetical protein
MTTVRQLSQLPEGHFECRAEHPSAATRFIEIQGRVPINQVLSAERSRGIAG